MQNLRQKLYAWYHDNKRDLPWRHTNDAYLIWLSEVILQQTQVVQGLPYYLKFVQHFPTVQALAEAQEAEVLKLWQGLGYYSRARNLHTAAKQVMASFGGIFPTQYDELMQLKGVGDYTASAVAAFSSGEAKACVDGNVIRVISRLFNVDVPYDTAQGKKIIKSLADEFLFVKDSALHNQAIMEFGALQCTPKKTACETCVFQSECLAFADNSVTLLPVKSKKTKVEQLFLYYFVFLHNDDMIIQQRSSSGIWKNLYEFPLVESTQPMQENEILQKLSEIHSGDVDIAFSKVYKHVLSHRKIEAQFIKVKCSTTIPVIPDTLPINRVELEKYPVSRLVERYCINEGFLD